MLQNSIVLRHWCVEGVGEVDAIAFVPRIEGEGFGCCPRGKPCSAVTVCAACAGGRPPNVLPSLQPPVACSRISHASLPFQFAQDDPPHDTALLCSALCAGFPGKQQAHYAEGYCLKDGCFNKVGLPHTSSTLLLLLFLLHGQEEPGTPLEAKLGSF